MRKLLLIITISFISYQSFSQGCVAIRSNGGTCTMTGAGHDSNQDNWIFSTNYRYFRSYKHFVGTAEQKQRVANGTEVVNHVSSFDLDLVRVFNSRWSLGVFVPVSSNMRSSLYEHDNIHRYSTSSFGIGDVRFAAYYWLIDPAKNSKINIQAGLGIKLPTGDYRYQDYFNKTETKKILGPVDQSIQLGDGGTGITMEANAFYNVSRSFGIYANGYYLINPREQNGVSTARGGVASDSAIFYSTDVMSVPDQYMVRAGADFKLNSFTFSAGLRMECVPSHDLVGGSNGFRRPGYVLSAEPVVSYKHNKMQLYVSVPYAIQRNRTQSASDILKTQRTGVYTQGDAAFADYTVNVGLAISLK